MKTQTIGQAVGQLIELDPATLTIATNVRTDVAEDKDFAQPIKTRSVLEPVTVYPTRTAPTPSYGASAGR